MGGMLSCVRVKQKNDEAKEESPKPNQYEEVDDNFTILPTSNNRKNTTNDDVTSSTTRTQNVNVSRESDGLNYENVTITSENKQTNLRNYEPKTSSGANKRLVNGIDNALYDTNSSDVMTTSSIGNEDAGDTMYVNCAMASRENSQSSLDKVEDGEQRMTANQNPAQDKETRKKKKKGNKSEEIKVKAGKPAKPPKTFHIKKDKKSTSSTSPASSNTQQQQLNYIEVEFTNKATNAAKTTGSKGFESADTDNTKSASTNYTDVVHEGGRLVLIR